MTLQIREATPATRCCLMRWATASTAHTLNKRQQFLNTLLSSGFFAFLFSHSSYFSCCPQMREIIVFTSRLSR
jgi:hypothetical protein